MKMTDKERKHQSICDDFDWLIKRGKKLELICEIVAFKYYISANTAYLIYSNKMKQEKK